MRVLTFANLKGGSGKTTSALSVGAQLAAVGHSVVLVDLDPQATLTASAGLSQGDEAWALLSGSAQAGPTLLTEAPGLGGRLVVLRASRRLTTLEEMSPIRIGRRLIELYDACENAFDFVVVDTPPQVSPLVTGALSASDEVYVPVASGRGAFDGLGEIVGLIRRNGTVSVTGTFVTRVVVSTAYDVALVGHLEQTYGPLALKSFVRETVRVREAENAQVPLPLFAPDSTAAVDYAAVAAEIAARPTLT